jgi:hypothetical protein
VGHIDACLPEDLDAVAKLHRQVFHRKDKPASPALMAYYRRLFFENPWQAEEVSSLVWRESDGTVGAFLGIVPRPMMWGEKPILAAVGHRLMLAKGIKNQSLVATRLIRECLSGKQDLFISDGTTDAGRRIAQAGGAVVVPQYSMRWICPVRPFSWRLSGLAQSRKSRLLASPAVPIANAIDRLATSVSGPAPYLSSGRQQAEDFSIEDLAESIELGAEGFGVRPVYDVASLGWMLEFMAADPFRGKIHGFTLRIDGQLLGTCLYYDNGRGGYEAIVIAGDGIVGTRALIFELLSRAYQRGANHVFGRFEPRLAEPLWELRCQLKPSPSCWTVTHAASPGLVGEVQMGRIFLSNLEAELWMGVPMSYDD